MAEKKDAAEQKRYELSQHFEECEKKCREAFVCMILTVFLFLAIHLLLVHFKMYLEISFTVTLFYFLVRRIFVQYSVYYNCREQYNRKLAGEKLTSQDKKDIANKYWPSNPFSTKKDKQSKNRNESGGGVVRPMNKSPRKSSR